MKLCANVSALNVAFKMGPWRIDIFNLEILISHTINGLVPQPILMAYGNHMKVKRSLSVTKFRIHLIYFNLIKVKSVTSLVFKNFKKNWLDGPIQRT